MDSGNLAASLWTLKQACLEICSEPPVRPVLWQGIRDHLEQIPGAARLRLQATVLGDDSAAWLKALPEIETQIAALDAKSSWWIPEAQARVRALEEHAVRTLGGGGRRRVHAPTLRASPAGRPGEGGRER